MVDVTLFSVGADHQSRDPQAVAVHVHGGRDDVVEEATPVIPGQKDGGAVPEWAPHDGIDEPGHIRLSCAHQRRRMLTHVSVRHDPAHRGEGAGRDVGEEVIDGLDVPQLVVLVHRGEKGQGVPDLRCPGRLRFEGTSHLVVLAVGLRAFGHIVLPAHVVLVQKVGEIGPRVVGSRHYGAAQSERLGLVDIAGAAHRVIHLAAQGRPFRHHEEVRRQAPRGIRLEHVILEHEIPGVSPVVRNLVLVVVPHHVGGTVGCTGWLPGRVAGCAHARLGLGDEPVHSPPVDVAGGGLYCVGPPLILIRRVVIGPHASAELRVR